MTNATHDGEMTGDVRQLTIGGGPLDMSKPDNVAAYIAALKGNTGADAALMGLCALAVADDDGRFSPEDAWRLEQHIQVNEAIFELIRAGYCHAQWDEATQDYSYRATELGLRDAS